jgi:hypothetical protein
MTVAAKTAADDLRTIARSMLGYAVAAAGAGCASWAPRGRPWDGLDHVAAIRQEIRERGLEHEMPKTFGR